MSDILNPGGADIEKFNKALQTNRTQVVPVWRRGDRMQVRAMGHLHPEQFKELVVPTQYSRHWDLITHESDSPLFDRAPNLRESRDQFVGNVEYNIDDLISSVREHGVQKPVIISKNPDESFAIDPETVQWKKDEQGKPIIESKHSLIDGHHRAYAAIRAGRPIPVWTATEDPVKLR